MHVLPEPRLPEHAVSHVLIAGSQPEIYKRLRALGLQVFETLVDMRLPTPVAAHPDMQLFDFGYGHMFGIKGSPLKKILADISVHYWETEGEPGRIYPKDVLCNGFVLNQVLYGNLKAIDSRILSAANARSIRLQHVSQGYAACSVCIVDKQSIITADASIANAAEKNGIAVLQIDAGGILLPGYDTGFIGGCCGKLSDTAMAFTGDLCSHPNGVEIQNFLHRRSIQVVTLTDKPLLDIGGIIPLGTYISS